MSKIVERVIVSPLMEYLSTNDLLRHVQSAYRKRHSTEAAMLRVLSDVLLAAEVQQVTLFTMLDLSAVFDCVDRAILLSAFRLVYHRHHQVDKCKY